MKMTSENKQTYFIVFENNSNSCWLDAALSLISHSKTIKQIVSDNLNCKMCEIISTCEEAYSVLNESKLSIKSRIKAAKKKLLKIQVSTLSYLQPLLKCQLGEPDSAFCALLNLIYQDKSVKEHLSVTYVLKKQCTNCGNVSKSLFKKPIITLFKVNSFKPDCPTSLYVCKCKSHQEMKLIYREVPSCIFFHFENGGGETTPPLIFTIKEKTYQLTGLVTLEKSQKGSPNHFITWIRDPSVNKWLECNDLNTDVISFSFDQPQYHVNDIHIIMYEALNDFGKIKIEESTDEIKNQDFQITSAELIDISDESECTKGTSRNLDVNTDVSTSLQNVKPTETTLADKLMPNFSDCANQEDLQEKLIIEGLVNSSCTENKECTEIVKIAGNEVHSDVTSNKVSMTKFINNEEETSICQAYDCKIVNINNQNYVVTHGEPYFVVSQQHKSYSESTVMFQGGFEVKVCEVERLNDADAKKLSEKTSSIRQMQCFGQQLTEDKQGINENFAINPSVSNVFVQSEMEDYKNVDNESVLPVNSKSLEVNTKKQSLIEESAEMFKFNFEQICDKSKQMTSTPTKKSQIKLRKSCRRRKYSSQPFSKISVKELFVADRQHEDKPSRLPKVNEQLAISGTVDDDEMKLKNEHLLWEKSASCSTNPCGNQKKISEPEGSDMTANIKNELQDLFVSSEEVSSAGASASQGSNLIPNAKKSKLNDFFHGNEQDNSASANTLHVGNVADQSTSPARPASRMCPSKEEIDLIAERLVKKNCESTFVALLDEIVKFHLNFS